MSLFDSYAELVISYMKGLSFESGGSDSRSLVLFVALGWVAYHNLRSFLNQFYFEEILAGFC